MASTLTSAELSAISSNCTYYAMICIFQDWIKFALSNKFIDKLTFLVCQYPESPYHDLHAMGIALVEAFYMQYLYDSYMNPTEAKIEEIRLYLLKIFHEREQSPMDVKVTPPMLEYLEGFLDPILFPHNLRVLFNKGEGVKKFLKLQLQNLINRTNQRRIEECTPSDTLLRELNHAQLQELAQTHRSVWLQCKPLSRQATVTLLRSHSVSKDLPLRVHAQICLRQLCKAPLYAKGSDLVEPIARRIHEELYNRSTILPNVQIIIRLFKVSFDTSTWLM